MKYSTVKKIVKIQDGIIYILFSPLRWLFIPLSYSIERLKQKYKKERIYSEKQICEVIQYLIDY